MKKADKSLRKYIPYMILSWLAVFITICTEWLYREENIQWTNSFLIKTTLISLAVGCLSGALMRFLLSVLAGKISVILCKRDNVGEQKEYKAGRILIGSFVILVLFWIPTWLAYYPGICAYDSYVQVEQIALNQYNEHHPLVHTLLIRLFLDLGRTLFSSPTHGIGLFTLLQLLFLALICSRVVVFAGSMIQKATQNRVLSCAGFALLTFLFAVCPFNSYMAVSVTKDIPFTCFLILALQALLSLVIPWSDHSKKQYMLYFLGLCGTIVFRNNGKYAAIVLIGSLSIAALIGIRKHKSTLRPVLLLLLCTILSMIMSLMALSVTFRVTGAGASDKREMLSVPIQQLARTMIYHGGVGLVQEDDNSLSEQEKGLISDFLLKESYLWYDPYISDPVKRNTNTSITLRRTGEFVSTYFRLFWRYPGDYCNAFLALNAGILSPLDRSHAQINLSETETGLGYIQTRWEENILNQSGIRKQSLLPGWHDVLEQWAAENRYLELPVIEYLLRPGIYLWLYLFLILVVVEKRAYSILLPLSEIAGYYITMFFGPTVQLRYVYPVMLAFPLLLAAGLSIVRIQYLSDKRNERSEE